MTWESFIYCDYIHYMLNCNKYMIRRLEIKSMSVECIKVAGMVVLQIRQGLSFVFILYLGGRVVQIVN